MHRIRLSIAIKPARKNLLDVSKNPQPIQQINEKDLEIYFIARIHNLFWEKRREQIALLKLNIRFQVIE